MTTKFKAGDVVTYVNQQGVVFPDKTITGIDRSDWALECAETRYFFSPSDAPWFSVEESGFCK